MKIFWKARCGIILWISVEGVLDLSFFTPLNKPSKLLLIFPTPKQTNKICTFKMVIVFQFYSKFLVYYMKLTNNLYPPTNLNLISSLLILMLGFVLLVWYILWNFNFHLHIYGNSISRYFYILSFSLILIDEPSKYLFFPLNLEIK